MGRLPLAVTFRHGAELALAMGIFKDKPSQSGLAAVADIARLSYPAGDGSRAGEQVVKALRLWKRRRARSATAPSCCATATSRWPSKTP